MAEADDRAQRISDYWWDQRMADAAFAAAETTGRASDG